MSAIAPPTGSSSDERLLDKIAEEFIEQLRGGKQPDPSEYARRYPQVADQLRICLKTLLTLEQAGNPHRLLQPSREEIEAITTDLQIIERIGTGGMGSVWKATQLSLNRPVAVKVLHQVDWTQSRQRLLEEARIASSLSHEHIVPVHDVFPEAPRPYFVMQFIPGCSLSQVIRAWKTQRDKEKPAADPATAKSGSASAPAQEIDTQPFRLGYCTSVPPRSFRQIAEWMQQAAAAVHFAHQNNVLHRDLKPSNFIIDEKQKIWLTDFGLAKRPRHGDLSIPGQAPGTLRYMSPEQCDGRATTLSDVYSLGVTLYEMLALNPAFEEHSSRSLPQQIRTGTCRQLLSHDPTIPLDLVVITQKAMALQQQDRYESAKALADDLQRYLDGKPILARPMSAAEQLRRLIGRHKLFSAVTALAAVLFVATSAIAVYSEILRVTGLNSEIAKLLSEASEIAKSQLPAQQSRARDKIQNAVRLAGQLGAPADSLTRIRDSIAPILDTPELVLSAPLPTIDQGTLNNFVVARNRTRIIVLGSEHILEVRDGQTGSLQAQIQLSAPPLDFEISADGCCLLVSTPAPTTPPDDPPTPVEPAAQLACWDLTPSQPALRWTRPGLPATAITLLPNKPQLVAADSDGSVHRIDLNTGRLLQLYPCTGPNTAIQLRPHPHQPVVAVCSELYHEIHVLNLDSGQVVSQIPRSGVSGFDWHPDGHLLALHDELREIELLHWPSLHPYKTIHKHIGLTHCRFSPDGRWLAIGVWSSTGAQTQLVAIRIEDQYTLTCPWPYIPDGKSHLWNHDGTELATLFYGNKIYRASMHDPQLFQHFDVTTPGISVAPGIAPARNLPLIVANTLGVPGQMLNLQTGTTLTATLPARPHTSVPYVSMPAWHTSGITSLDYFSRKLWHIQPYFTQQGDLLLNTRSRIRLPLSQGLRKITPDGSRVFSISNSGRILYFPTDDPLAFRCLPLDFRELINTSHTGRLIVCQRKTNDSVLYDCDAEQILEVFDQNIYATFSPDESCLLVARDPQHDEGTRFLYDIKGRKHTHSLPAGPAYSSFSDSGSLLAIRFVSEQFIRLIQTSTGTTLLKLPVEADNLGTPFFADNDQRLFIHSIGHTSSRLYSIDLQKLLTQYAGLGLPTPALQPAPAPAKGSPEAKLLAAAQSARTVTFSSATTPLHRQFTAALCRSLYDLTRSSPAPKNHFAPLLTSICCDALELGCLDVASLALGWRQLQGAPSAGVTAVRGSLLLRQNQPAQALQLLQSPDSAADCDMTLQYNRCLALSLLNRPADALEEFDRVQQANTFDSQKPMLTLLKAQLSSTAAEHDGLSQNDYLTAITRLLLHSQDFRSHQLALHAAQQATRRWPAAADCWQIQALAEICHGLPDAAASSLAKARQMKQNRNDAGMQLIEAAIHLHNEDFHAWFLSLLKTNQLLNQQATGLPQIYSIGRDLPLAITLQVPVRTNSISGRLYRWLLLAESQFLGHTHVDVLLKTRTGT